MSPILKLALDVAALIFLATVAGGVFALGFAVQGLFH